MDLDRLRHLLRHPIVGLKDAGTHDDLGGFFERLGMCETGGNTKRERMQLAFDATPDDALPSVAERYLAAFNRDPLLRNEVQEILWATAAAPHVPKKHRRELARALAVSDLYGDADEFMSLLSRLWVIDGQGFDFLSGTDRSLRTRIVRHVFRNPDDWSVEHLFKELGAYDCSDRRFQLFLEGLSSSRVHPDEPEQRRLAVIANRALAKCGAELRETGYDGGYPVFSLVSTADGAQGKPKNLIFASPVKPDLRFRDAVNNDIEIVTNAAEVLVYDRPIGNDGLLWRDLQAWWAETRGIAAATDAKKTLYARLLRSLPSSSPPQVRLFKAFFATFRSRVPALPALLPEVWLHWDPKTVRERGTAALARFRMDFLMLLSGNARVVIEVDGKQHFADDAGRADPARYGEMVSADRDLRLAGYEVYRFGASELDEAHGSALVADFFGRLFRRHGISVP